MSNEEKVIQASLGIIAMLLMVSFLGFLFWGWLFGDYFQKITEIKTVVVATTTVSIIKEQQDCAREGGVFDLWAENFQIEWNNGEPDTFFNVDKVGDIKIECIRNAQPQVIFSKKLHL